MPMWREYQCERCASRVVVKDVTLAGRILCPQCAGTPQHPDQHKHLHAEPVTHTYSP